MILTVLTLLLRLHSDPAVDDPVVRGELDRWCQAFQRAESTFPDEPLRAYADVNEHHNIPWLPLAKTAAGMRGIFSGGRYPMVLRFARIDYDLKDWECAAMDRILLGVAAGEKAAASAHPGPQLSVSKEGHVHLDGKRLRDKEIAPALRALKQRSNIVELYREGWRTRMHPVARDVLNALVTGRFIIDLQARARSE
jgi:hypothetical protein